MGRNNGPSWDPPVGETQASPGSVEIPLFQSPFYKDWIVLLSLGGAWVTARESVALHPSLFSDFSAIRLIDASLQTLVLVGVQISILGLLPAYIRMRVRFRRTREGKGISAPPNLKGKHYVLLVLLASLLAIPFSPVVDSAPPQSNVSAGSTPAATPANTKIARSCFDNGEDTVCLEGERTTRRVVVDFSYRYSVPKTIDVYNINEWRWRIAVNCTSRTGSISNFEGLIWSGDAVSIPFLDRRAMEDGLEAEWVPIVLSECT